MDEVWDKRAVLLSPCPPDNDGAVAAVTDSASGITSRQYFDMSGRAVGYSETAANFTHTVGYEYDNINNLTQLVESINGVEKTTSYTYDEDNRATAITTDGTTVEYTYDGLGRVTQQVTKIKGETAEQDQVILTEYFTFTEPSATATSGQVATYRTVSAGLDITYSYTYDANGNILTVSDGTNVTGYTYDTANQLIREDNQAKGKTYTWTYDAGGNITAYKTYDYTTGELNGEPDVVTYSYDKKADTTDTDYWGDLLISYAGTAVTYEYQEATEVLQEDGTTKTCYNIGNPTQLNGRSYTWEHGRQLATLTENNTTWNYTYNNAGLRTGRYVVNGASYKYIYNGSQLVQMTVTANNSTQVVNFTYDAAGTPLTMKVGNATYYYITNLQGDVMGLMDSTGNMVVSYEYSAYGVRTVTLGDGTTAEQLNPLTYRGYVYDSETGLYYVSSRYYDSEIGRWINADKQIAGVGGDILGYNTFAYCMNNPVNMSDSSGNWPRWITAAVTVVAAVVTVAAVATGNFAVASVAAKVTMAAGATYIAQSAHYDRRETKNDVATLPQSPQEAKDSGWRGPDTTPKGPAADCHQYTAKDGPNKKYVSPDGHREVIYNSAEDIVLDSRDIGTYNFCPSNELWYSNQSIGHLVHDIIPWVIFGNSDDDPGWVANEIIRLFE